MRTVERTDYPDSDTKIACARKKAYSTAKLAAHVAAEMNKANADEHAARPGFFGVTVAAYACTRCGFWHIGTIPQ
jgi:hypothetical protein